MKAMLKRISQYITETVTRLGECIIKKRLGYFKLIEGGLQNVWEIGNKE